MKPPIPNGTRVLVLRSEQRGLFPAWGIVTSFDGERWYHVAPFNGSEQLVFERSDLRVQRTQPYFECGAFPECVPKNLGGAR